MPVFVGADFMSELRFMVHKQSEKNKNSKYNFKPGSIGLLIDWYLTLVLRPRLGHPGYNMSFSVPLGPGVQKRIARDVIYIPRLFHFELFVCLSLL